MDVPTAIGLGGVSVTALTLVIGFLYLVKKCLSLGSDANTARAAQIEAEGQRNTALARATGAEAERDAALAALAKAKEHAAEISKKRQKEVEEDIIDASGDDLIILSRRIMGLRPEMSQASPTTPGNDSDDPNALLNPFGTKEGRSDEPKVQ